MTRAPTPHSFISWQWLQSLGWSQSISLESTVKTSTIAERSWRRDNHDGNCALTLPKEVVGILMNPDPAVDERGDPGSLAPAENHWQRCSKSRLILWP